jgi:hypothetical protein
MRSNTISLMIENKKTLCVNRREKIVVCQSVIFMKQLNEVWWMNSDIQTELSCRRLPNFPINRGKRELKSQIQSHVIQKGTRILTNLKAQRLF